MGTALSLPSPDRFSASYQGWEACTAVSSAPIEAHTLHLSDSEELDVVSSNAKYTEDSPPQSHAYEELVEVVTRAFERLSIDWPAEREDVRSKSRLDERFLPSCAQPQRRGLPVFPDLYTDVYLFPESSSSARSPVLPTKPVRTTSALVEKAYSAAGQAAACLHTMSLLQAYQAELLADLNEGEGIGPNAVCELCRATDLSLRGTKETARLIGRSMTALVATERHLWLNLNNIKQKDKNFLMDAPLSSSGLFGDAVNSVVERFQESAKQAAAFQKLLPCRILRGC